MLIAVVVTGIGLLIVGFGRQNWRTLVAAGTFMGLGVAAMHYSGMAAMRLTGRMTYSPTLFILSVIIAIVASTVALWMGSNLSRVRSTLVAAAIAGVAVSGMHYTGMAALHMWPAGAGGGMNMAGGGATAVGFLLPLLIGISILAFIMTATIALSPSSEEMREDAELLQRIAATQNGAYAAPPQTATPRSQHWPTHVVSRGTQARRQGAGTDRPGSP
jgi:NO-binding membrane sensor protein with MHYT domain